MLFRCTSLSLSCSRAYPTAQGGLLRDGISFLLQCSEPAVRDSSRATAVRWVGDSERVTEQYFVALHRGIGYNGKKRGLT